MNEETGLTVQEAPREMTKLSPREMIEEATEEATVLASVIERQQLYSMIQGRKYVKCEGWTTLAALRGCVPSVVKVEEIGEGVFVATAELVRMRDGQVITRAQAECGSADEVDRKGEPIWASRPRFARISMAQTRAMAKVCKVGFSWVMVLAGFEPTPTEEMEHVRNIESEDPKPAPAPARKPAGGVESARGDATRPCWQGRILEVVMKEGQKAGKPWKKYEVLTDDKTWYFTFSEEIADLARSHVGKVDVVLEYEQTQYGRKLLEVVRMG